LVVKKSGNFKALIFRSEAGKSSGYWIGLMNKNKGGLKCICLLTPFRMDLLSAAPSGALAFK